MLINESAENYLETILILSQRLPVVRSVDIATELGYKKSSVSIAMKNLREKKHITVADSGYIYLTDSGPRRRPEGRHGGRLQDRARHQPREL